MATTADEMIDGLIDAGSEEMPELDDGQIDRLTDDLAKKIYPYPVLARRFLEALR